MDVNASPVSNKGKDIDLFSHKLNVPTFLSKLAGLGFG
jgi:hypothetical protein